MKVPSSLLRVAALIVLDLGIESIFALTLNGSVGVSVGVIVRWKAGDAAVDDGLVCHGLTCVAAVTVGLGLSLVLLRLRSLAVSGA